MTETATTPRAVSGDRRTDPAAAVPTQPRCQPRCRCRNTSSRSSATPARGRRRRSDLRRHQRQDGQRRLDRRDHPGGDPAAGALAGRCQRHPHPALQQHRHQHGRRGRCGGGLQRAGACTRASPTAPTSAARWCCWRTSGAMIRCPRSASNTPRRWPSIAKTAWPSASCPSSRPVWRSRRRRAAARTCSCSACSAGCIHATWTRPSKRSRSPSSARATRSSI
jgi:hypothetical protein